MAAVLHAAVVRRRLTHKQRAEPYPALRPTNLVLDGVALAVAAVVRRRLTHKQRVEPYPAFRPAIRVLDGVALAVAAENAAVLAADGLLPMPLDARRRTIHWTHCRTANPEDVQPHTLTREGFYLHLARCYAEAYRERCCSGSRQPSLDFSVIRVTPAPRGRKSKAFSKFDVNVMDHLTVEDTKPIHNIDIKI